MSTQPAERGASRRVGRVVAGACLSLLLAELSVALVPNATAATPTHISGELASASSVWTSSVLKGGKNYSTFSDVFQFAGDLSGNCTGSDTSIVGLGPGNLSQNGTGFIHDSGSCSFAGSLAGTAGGLTIRFLSSTGFDAAEDKFAFLFLGENGTGGLASAHLTNGVLLAAGTFTASVQSG